jgi:hypothetical protein
VLGAQGTITDGSLVVSLTADGAEIGGADLGVSIPLAWSPDGAFLTVGYGRQFPVSEDYEPPATAPASLLDIEITVGPAPAFDLDAEIARILWHQ